MRQLWGVSALLVGCAVTVTAGLRLARPAWSDLDPESPTSVVLAVCAVVLFGCLVWLVAVTVLALAAYVVATLAPGSEVVARLCRLAERGCPRLLARLLAACLGVAVGTGMAAPVLAQPLVQPHRPSGLTGLALPERTTGDLMSVAATPRLTSRPTPGADLVVRAGDSLWTITARLLPPDASAAEVAEGWHRLYRANPARVGTDPDLILPGTRLRVPDLTPHRKEPT